MEKICLEDVVLGLMYLGFDKVDNLLLGFVLEKVLNNDLYHFKLENNSSQSPYNYINFDNGIYQIKDEDELKNNNITSLPIKTVLFLNSNKKLIKYLKTIDFRTIILKKIKSIGVNNLDSMNYLFSNQEKMIIMKIFGIELDCNKLKR